MPEEGGGCVGPMEGSVGIEQAGWSAIVGSKITLLLSVDGALYSLIPVLGHSSP